VVFELFYTDVEAFNIRASIFVQYAIRNISIWGKITKNIDFLLIRK